MELVSKVCRSSKSQFTGRTRTSTDLRKSGPVTEAVDFGYQAPSSNTPEPEATPEASSSMSISSASCPNSIIDDRNTSMRTRASSESWYTNQNVVSNADWTTTEPRIRQREPTLPRTIASSESFIGSTPATVSQEPAETPHLWSRPNSPLGLKRRLTTLIPDPDNKGPANKDKAVELDAGEPGNVGQWAVDQHLDGLLREIVHDSAR